MTLAVAPTTPNGGRKTAHGELCSSPLPLQIGTYACPPSAAATTETTGFDKVDKNNSPVRSSTTEEQLLPPAKGKEEALECNVGTQALDGSSQLHDSANASDRSRQQEQQEGTTSAANATPITTPEKQEVPRRRWQKKKSLKGAVRFKVMKDSRPKLTPKTAKRGKTRQKRKAAEGCEGAVLAGGDKSTRRKLDFDGLDAGQPSSSVESLESNAGCFSRAVLMDSLRGLVKMHTLLDDMSVGKRRKGGKKRQRKMTKHKGSDELALVPWLQHAPTDASSSYPLVPGCDDALLAVVPYTNRQRKLKTKVVDLDEKTIQVYDALKKSEETNNESFEGVDIGSGPEWDESRRYFEQWTDKFISNMRDLVGHRTFSKWGGSVIDSVVGAFLTQNVSDNLSSNAFMNLVAKFPPTKRCKEGEGSTKVHLLTNGDEENSDLHNTTDGAASVLTEHDDDFDKEGPNYDEELKGESNLKEEEKRTIENFIANLQQEGTSTEDMNRLMNLLKDRSGHPIYSPVTVKKFIAALKEEDTSHWDTLRKEAYSNGYTGKNSTEANDSVDWEAVIRASFIEVAKCIKDRGQHYLLALRIQHFLKRVKGDHGSIDLEWLRNVPPASAKNYLLSVHGLGYKSVDCIRLLSLHHRAFPVDVNVARIVTRLGWVRLQPLPFSAEFHLVDLYPIMADVQRYLWPRLCTMNKQKLYELHCLMITFGKIICTKINPNCGACPLSAECKYYKSSFNRAALPSGEHGQEHGVGSFSSNSIDMSSVQQIHPHQIEMSKSADRHPVHNYEPIIEMPPSPQHEYSDSPPEQDLYEDVLCGDVEDSIPWDYDVEIDLRSNKNTLNNGYWRPENGKDLILINPQCAFSRSPKLKNQVGLRTQHHAYVLKDDHPVLEKFDQRVPDDRCPYLFIVRPIHGEHDDHTVRGTILIPCRTANRGSFPLNGTYFQDHEVFADHSSSHYPIKISRQHLLDGGTCKVYFGSSIHSITKGQSSEDIRQCFTEGYICVRGFDRRTRYPRKLCAKLHCTNESNQSNRKRSRSSLESEKSEKTPQ